MPTPPEPASVAAAAALLVARLAERGWTLAVAESLTGGAVASAIVAVPGASAVLRGAVVAYATDVKARLLGVDAALLAERGAVDPEVAAQMAGGARRALGAAAPADLGLATTGVAGPEPQDGVAVGTVFVAADRRGRVTVERLGLAGDRAAIRESSVLEVLRLALRALGDARAE